MTTVPDNWEDLIDSGEEDTPNVPQSQQEKIKQQKLVERSDRELADDLFDDMSNVRISDTPKKSPTQKKKKDEEAIYTDHTDPFETVSLNTHREAEDLAQKITTVIEKSDKAKPPIMMRFVDLILQKSYSKLDAENMRILMNHIKDAREARIKEDNLAKQKPSKASYGASKYQDEMDMMYGDLEYDEFDEEEYDDANYN